MGLVIDITDWFLAQNIDFQGLKSFCEVQMQMPKGVARNWREGDNFPTIDNPVAKSGFYMSYKKTNINHSNTIIQQLSQVLGDEFGTSELSGCHFYPAQGFMGWHTNSNYSGTRVYISYSKEANSNSFSYIENGEVVQSYDRVGFTVRKFEVDNSNLFWHRVDASTKRFSLGFRDSSS